MGKIDNDNEVICLKTDAFKSLVDTLMVYVRDKHGIEQKWICAEEAMRLLNISSRTSLQVLKDTGKIKFSFILSKKNTVYDKESILEYIESNAKKMF
ncbi:MAG: DNA-binding protein [Bacteroidota bacterium]|nr:DNA-binding protein [Bacteroidota bacterium]